MTARRDQDTGRMAASVVDMTCGRHVYSFRARVKKWIRTKVNRYLRRKAKIESRTEDAQ